jgi:hypothetical protein
MDHVELFQKGIVDFITEFQSHPFNFLYERDLQSFLFSATYQHFIGARIQMRGGYHSLGAYGGKDYIDTIPIKCEYPRSQRFDVALINKDEVEHYDPEIRKQARWRNDRFWNQSVRVAIEIKYLQLGDSLSGKAADFQKDIEKLTNYQRENPELPFLGIALICVQSDAFNTSPFCIGESVESSGGFPLTGIFRHVVTPSSVLTFIA